MRHPTELLALRRRSCCSSKLVRVLDECAKCVEEAAVEREQELRREALKAAQAQAQAEALAQAQRIVEQRERQKEKEREIEKERAEKAARLASLDEIAVFFKGVGVADIEQSGLSIELLKLGVTSPKDLLLLDQVIDLHND